MKEKMLNIGNGVSVSTGRIVCILPIPPASKALMARAEKQENLIDTSGRKKKRSVILTDIGVVFISQLQPDTIRKRVDQLFGEAWS